LQENRTGHEQFYRHETSGELPESPDVYYRQLRIGKKSFDLLCREYHQLYVKGEWWGFYQLWEDWKGSRWMLLYLCSWYKKELPRWLINEEEELDFE
jgi:hypothetical protein